MANDNPKDAPFPIGTVNEVLTLGLNPGEVRTCAMPETGAVKGCRFFGHKGGCVFHELWAGGEKRTEGIGPENRGLMKIVTETGSWQGFDLPCFTHMETNVERIRQSKELGEVYSQWYVPGETIKQQFREKLHKERDPNCDGCKKGECTKMKTVVHEHVVQKFQRPAERYPSAVFAQELMRGQSGAIPDFERRIGALIDHSADLEDAKARRREQKPQPSESLPLKDQIRRG